MLKDFTQAIKDKLESEPRLHAVLIYGSQANSIASTSSDIDIAYLDKAIKDVITIEFGVEDLPIVTNMDFGHTDPQFVLPLGILTEMDITKKTFKLIEPCFND
jgi:muramoyltetrapeptide carboxypeptidase LdcA involved in peptidoglycan recycling